MAKLYISEYASVGYVAGLSLPIQSALEPSVDQAPLDFTSGAQQSAAFAATTTFVRVWSDADCCIKFGANPTATTANKPIGAKNPEYFGVTPGKGLKLSVIAAS